MHSGLGRVAQPSKVSQLPFGRRFASPTADQGLQATFALTSSSVTPKGILHPLDGRRRNRIVLSLKTSHLSLQSCVFLSSFLFNSPDSPLLVHKFDLIHIYHNLEVPASFVCETLQSLDRRVRAIAVFCFAVVLMCRAEARLFENKTFGWTAVPFPRFGAVVL